MISPFSAQTHAELNQAYSTHSQELKQDIWFFGGIGVLLGFLANAYDQLEKKGVKLSLDLVNELMKDFMSVKAALFICCLSILISALRNLMRNRGTPLPRLNAAAFHVAARLRQLTSSLTCFALGFAVGLGLTVLGTLEIQALVLAAMVATIGVSISGFGLLGTVIEQRIGETSSTWASLVMLTGTLAYVFRIAIAGF
jgi:hypothetical protein